MYEYNPGNLPGLPAGWEIEVDRDRLALWRIRAYLHPYKETVYESALMFACGRYADAYLPENYSQSDVQEALQELVYKANQLDNDEDDYGPKYDQTYTQANRPSRSAFNRKF